MSFFDGLKISSSGLSAQRLRMNIISSNLANANTTRTEDGGPYKKKEVVFEAQPRKIDFGATLKDAMKSISGVLVYISTILAKYHS